MLCDPIDGSPTGSSVHGLFQARILEWVAMSFSRVSSKPRDWAHISCVSYIGRWVLYHWATWEVLPTFPPRCLPRRFCLPLTAVFQTWGWPISNQILTHNNWEKMGELIFMLSWGHHDCIRASGQRRNECLTRALRGLVCVNTHPQGIKTVVPPP